MCKADTPCKEIIELQLLMRETHAATKRMERHLTGNGNPSAGLLMKVDRLEQTEKRRAYTIRALVVSWCGAVVIGVWGLLTGKT